MVLVLKSTSALTYKDSHTRKLLLLERFATDVVPANHPESGWPWSPRRQIKRLCSEPGSVYLTRVRILTMSGGIQ
jgi:hypothetical protein